MSPHSSHPSSRQSSRGRRSNASPVASRRTSIDKMTQQKRSLESSRLSATGSTASSESSYISTSSESSSNINSSGRRSPDKAQQATRKADRCVRYLNRLEDKDRAYWDKQAASTDNTRSAGSSVFGEMSGMSATSPSESQSKKLAKKLSKELETAGKTIEETLGAMQWFVPQTENGKQWSYRQYAKDVSNKYRMRNDTGKTQLKQSDFLDSRDVKIAIENRRGYSLILKVWPKLIKDLQEAVEAYVQLQTRTDSAYLAEVRTLLSKLRSHANAIKECKDIQETLMDYHHPLGVHRRR